MRTLFLLYREGTVSYPGRKDWDTGELDPSRKDWDTKGLDPSRKDWDTGGLPLVGGPDTRRESMESLALNERMGRIV